MEKEGKLRRKALFDRLKAKRRSKEAELERRGAGEGDMRDQDADLSRLEELAAEVCTHFSIRYEPIEERCGAIYLV